MPLLLLTVAFLVNDNKEKEKSSLIPRFSRVTIKISFLFTQKRELLCHTEFIELDRYSHASAKSVKCIKKGKILSGLLRKSITKKIFIVVHQDHHHRVIEQ